jgi:hypothetical protein
MLKSDESVPMGGALSRQEVMKSDEWVRFVEAGKGFSPQRRRGGAEDGWSDEKG